MLPFSVEADQNRFCLVKTPYIALAILKQFPSVHFGKISKFALKPTYNMNIFYRKRRFVTNQIIGRRHLKMIICRNIMYSKNVGDKIAYKFSHTNGLTLRTTILHITLEYYSSL